MILSMMENYKMNCIDFVNATIKSFEGNLFDEIREILVGDYLPFSIIEKSAITNKILSEKLCDFFEKIELKSNKSFDKQIKNYMDEFDSIVKSRIAKEPRQNKKSNEIIHTPRARKYYNKAISLKSEKDITIKTLLDYSRIMMCLYTATSNSSNKDIENFDYSIGCLNIEQIIKSMKQEKLLVGKKNKFNTTEINSVDNCTFILTIIMFYYIKSMEVAGE